MPVSTPLILPLRNPQGLARLKSDNQRVLISVSTSSQTAMGAFRKLAYDNGHFCFSASIESK